MENQKHQQVDPALETILLDLLLAIFSHLYLQHEPNKIAKENVLFMQKLQEKLKRGLITDANILKVMSTFVFLVVFKIIIL